MSSEAFETDKQKAIAFAAFEVFAEHGFRKTSMQLIAKKAGMSRPALYLHFQSKEDVFGYLSVDFFKKIQVQVETVLAAQLGPVETLQGVFDAFDPDSVMKILLDAEHGGELLDVKVSSAYAQVDDIMTNIRLSLTEWLRAQAAQGKILCDDPLETGQTIMASYYGLKSPPPSYAAYKTRVAQLATLLGRGLSA
ncbi:TetR/AcrR family transcriptional regulator [Planktotalea sp.]|uniref:TetR/AcrR family transcriptional regulator n=1 Tax=Planktotalea sp. TaxID=2029877 RepID=UPI003298F3BD